MKLLIAADIFPPESGGPATYCVTLANELVKQGVEVKIVSLNPESDKQKVNCPIFAVATRNKLWRYLHYVWLLFWYGGWADVLYAMGPVNAGFPAYIAARLRGKKLVVKVVGDYAWEQGRVLGLTKDGIDEFQGKNYAGKIGELNKHQETVVRNADGIIVPSEYLKRLVVGWGASPEKVRVIFNAVEVPSVRAAVKPPLERWVVTVARLTPWKGVRALIEAVTEIKNELPEIKLKIVGDGPEMFSLQSLVAEKKATEIVEFLGNVPRLTGLSYVKAADVFVLNSSYEGMSHVILEAQILEVSVLASNKGGNPEIVAPESLFAFDNVEEIKHKIKNVLVNGLERAASGRQIMITGGKQVSLKEWSVPSMIEATHSVLMSLSNC